MRRCRRRTRAAGWSMRRCAPSVRGAGRHGADEPEEQEVRGGGRTERAQDEASETDHVGRRFAGVERVCRHAVPQPGGVEAAQHDPKQGDGAEYPGSPHGATPPRSPAAGQRAFRSGAGCGTCVPFRVGVRLPARTYVIAWPDPDDARLGFGLRTHPKRPARHPQ